MRCPNPECNSYHHRVKDTEGRVESLTTRVCICPKCGMIFGTVEYPVDSEHFRRLYTEYVRPGLINVENSRREMGTESD